MDIDGNVLVLAIIGFSTLGWVITTAIRAKHGYSITDDWGNVIPKEDPDSTRKFELLSDENERLRGQVSRLEERIAVMERIATDPAERVAREIDRLR